MGDEYLIKTYSTLFRASALYAENNSKTLFNKIPIHARRTNILTRVFYASHIKLSNVGFIFGHFFSMNQNFLKNVPLKSGNLFKIEAKATLIMNIQNFAVFFL